MLERNMLKPLTLTTQKGNSDAGILLSIAGLAVLIGLGALCMGWIQNVKDARHMRPAEVEKVIRSPYYEPGAFQVTF